MLTVACVLSTPSLTYNPGWVHRLKKSVEKNLSTPHRFVCLTNLPEIEGVETLPLTEGFPGWWAKIELFKPGQFDGPVLFLDLDMMACGSLDPLVGPWDSMVMLKDSPSFRHIYNSGLMWFDLEKQPELGKIFEEFKADTANAMEEYNGKNGAEMYGDQGFIYQIAKAQGVEVLKWQDLLPEEWFLEFSYDRNLNPVVADDSYDRSVRLCYSLGYPKFSTMPNVPIVQRHWEPLDS